MDDELKNCPFCDKTAQIIQFPDEGEGVTFCVACNNCDCRMGDESFGDHRIGEGLNIGAYHSEEEAVSAWNYRFND